MNMNEPTLQNLYTLQNKYDEKLTQYQQAFRDFQSTLTNITGLTNSDMRKLTSFAKSFDTANLNAQTDMDTSEVANILNKIKESSEGLIIKPDRGYDGRTTIDGGIIPAPSADSCLSSCKQNILCSGATYYKTNNTCVLQSGTGKVYADPNTDAIVNKVADLMQTIMEYNRQLIIINNQIKEEITSTPSNNQDSWDTATRNGKMNVVSRHNSLLVQHDIIDKLMKKYNTAATGVIESKLSTTQHFYWYRIWAVIFVSCLYIAILWTFGIMPSTMLNIMLLLFVTWIFGFKYLSLVGLTIYILYYIYMVPLD